MIELITHSRNADGWARGIGAALVAAVLLSAMGAGAEAREVRVGVYQNTPKVFMDEAGEPAGVFIDIIEEIADKEGWSLIFEPCEWSECIHALEAGLIDLMPDMAYSPERAKKFGFHETSVVQSFSLVYSDPGIPISRLSDLEDRRIAVLRDSIQEAEVRRILVNYGIEAVVIGAESFEEAFDLVKQGAADGAVANHFFGDYHHQEYGLVKTPLIFGLASLYYATARDRNSDLLEAVDRNLEVLTGEPESGYYASLRRWLEPPRPRAMPWYYPWILPGAAAFLLLAAAIILLLRRQVRLKFAVDVTRIKKAEANLAAMAAWKGVVAKASQRFLTFDDMNESIDACLADAGGYCGAERAYIFQFNPDGATMHNTHEWCAPGVKPEIGNLQNQFLQNFPWWMEMLEADKTINIESVADLPPVARAEREILEAQDIKSVLVVPLLVDNTLAGFMGFDHVTSARTWGEEELVLLRTLAEIIGGVLGRHRARAAIVEKNQKLEQLNEELQAGEEEVGAISEELEAQYAELEELIQQQANYIATIEALQHESQERIKELRCLYDIFEAVEQYNSLDAIFIETARIMPGGMQFPEFCRARVEFDGKSFSARTDDHAEWACRIRAEMIVAGDEVGAVEVGYIEEHEFSVEEKELVKEVARKLSREILKAQIEKKLVEAYYTINRSPVVVFVWRNEPGWPVEFVSDNVERIFGYQAQAFMTGRLDYEEIVHPDDLKRVAQAVISHNVAPACRGFVHKPYRIRAADGSFRWVLDRTDITRNPDGRVIDYRGIVEDITEQVKTEREMKQFEWLLEKTTGAGRPGFTDRAMPYGDVAELNTERVILDAVGGDALEDMCSDLMNLLDTSVAVYERNGDYAFGMFVSEWCGVMDSASRSLCNTDDNREALRCGKWFCHESCWNDSARAAIESGAPTDIECVGGIRLFAAPIRAGNEIVGSVNIGCGNPPTDPEVIARLAEKFDVKPGVLDQAARKYKPRPTFIFETAKKQTLSTARRIGEIVERKRANLELEQTIEELRRSNTELEQFAYVASHDLQEPLRMVTSYMQLLERKYGDKLDSEAEEFINFAAEGSKRMQTMIAALLEYARVRTAGREFQKIDCNAVAHDVLKNLEVAVSESGAEIVVDRLPLITGDEQQIGRVFQNLISNAMKFRGPGKLRVRISAEKREGSWVFSVRDNGIGIEPGMENKIFLIFQRLHGRGEYPGVGIGLAIAKRIVERHGGWIWVESSGDGGSIFFFTIPIREEKQ